MKINIYLLRHGVTAGTLENKYNGCRSDDSLVPSEDNAFIQLDGIKELFVSPMLRTRQTAKLVCPYIDPIIIEELKEFDFGDFEGKNYKELSNNPDYQKWVDSGCTIYTPNGESMQSFTDRAFIGLNKAISLSKTDSILCVVHGGTIMAIMSVLTGDGYFDHPVHPGEGFYLQCEYVNNQLSLIKYEPISCRI